MDSVQQSIWNRITDHIESVAVDGVDASGVFSEDLRRDQRSYVKGLRIARLKAINAATQQEVTP